MRLRVIAPMVGLVALVGCSTPSPSVAARIGDQTITVSELDAVVAGCKGALGEQAGEDLQGSLMSILVLGRAIDAVAGDAGIDLSREHIDNAISRAGTDRLAKDPECRKAVEAAARIDIVSGQFGQTKVPDLLRPVKIDLNPRYGRWDSKELKSVPGGSISEPAEEHTRPLR